MKKFTEILILAEKFDRTGNHARADICDGATRGALHHAAQVGLNEFPGLISDAPPPVAPGIGEDVVEDIGSEPSTADLADAEQDEQDSPANEVEQIMRLLNKILDDDALAHGREPISFGDEDLGSLDFDDLNWE